MTEASIVPLPCGGWDYDFPVHATVYQASIRDMLIME
jgi:hypothetical protein